MLAAKKLIALSFHTKPPLLTVINSVLVPGVPDTITDRLSPTILILLAVGGIGPPVLPVIVVIGAPPPPPPAILFIPACEITHLLSN